MHTQPRKLPHHVGPTFYRFLLDQLTAEPPILIGSINGPTIALLFLACGLLNLFPTEVTN